MSLFILAVFNEYKVQNKVPPVKSVLYGDASGGDEWLKSAIILF